MNAVPNVKTIMIVFPECRKYTISMLLNIVGDQRCVSLHRVMNIWFVLVFTFEHIFFPGKHRFSQKSSSTSHPSVV